MRFIFPHRRSEAGNILFLILLAVVLFAALSYAVTGTQKGQNKNATPEKMATLFAQLNQSLSLIENTFTRGRTTGGVPDWGFDFSGTNSSATANATCVSDVCRLFSGSGGRAVLVKLPDWAVDDTIEPDHTVNFIMVRILNVGTSLPDLVYKQSGITKEFCDYINKANGFTVNLSNADNYSVTGGNAYYTGTLTALPPGYGAIGNVPDGTAGRTFFCHRNNSNSDPVYNINYVLWAR